VLANPADKIPLPTNKTPKTIGNSGPTVPIPAVVPNVDRPKYQQGPQQTQNLLDCINVLKGAHQPRSRNPKSGINSQNLVLSTTEKPANTQITS